MIHAQIRVSGQVQGVGFRPFVFKLAHELGLTGWVRNDSEGVEIAVEGEQPKVMRLIELLQSEPPSLARVEKVTHDLTQKTTGLFGFSITDSKEGKVLTGIAPDMAICPDCLKEMFDPANRRYLHPFINCIHCGPRYTLTGASALRSCQHQHGGVHAMPGLPARIRLAHHAPLPRPAQCLSRVRSAFAVCSTRSGSRYPTNDSVAATAERIISGQVVGSQRHRRFSSGVRARNAAAVAGLRNGNSARKSRLR